jgi:hypothetical protein
VLGEALEHAHQVRAAIGARERVDLVDHHQRRSANSFRSGTTRATPA